MVSARRRAQFGVTSGFGVSLLAISIVVAGAFEKPNHRVGLPGTPAALFRLPDPRGNILTSRSLRGNVVVLCFAPAPHSKDASADISRLAELGRKYASNKDVRFVALFSGTDDMSAPQRRQIAELADQAGPRCATVIDPGHRTASLYAVADLPTFLIIDGAGTIRHRGGLDDSSPTAPLASTSLANVIDLLLAERPPHESANRNAVLSNIK